MGSLGLFCAAVAAFGFVSGVVEDWPCGVRDALTEGLIRGGVAAFAMFVLAILAGAPA